MLNNMLRKMKVRDTTALGGDALSLARHIMDFGPSDTAAQISDH